LNQTVFIVHCDLKRCNQNSWHTASLSQPEMQRLCMSRYTLFIRWLHNTLLLSFMH